jgi:acyl transferase domain-containing protein
LESGESHIKIAGPDNWDSARFFDQGKPRPGTINTQWVGRIEGMRYFDNAFFNVSPREAVALDPQHRILLEEAWHCIEDSGLPIGVLQSSRTSVNIGLTSHDYVIKHVSNNLRVDAFDPLGKYPVFASNRLSYLLDLRGPSRTVDTACSSSLVALDQALHDLLHEDCDFGLVGGVSMLCSPWRLFGFAQSRMLSPDGRCYTFDRRANGFVTGEGVGVVLITTRDRAERYGCYIYGVVKGVATNHNGHNRDLTAPSVDSQVDVITRALTRAGVTPADVGYVEAHGTGTSLGDPIEVEALSRVYSTGRDAPLQVGSVKPNIGHLEAGSGMAGLIKVLLMLRHGRIVPTVNCEVHNPLLPGVGECITFPDHLVDWPAGDKPRTAGVSSFGFGGVNCHVVIQESRGRIDVEDTEPDGASPVFTISAKTHSALVAGLAAWAQDERWADDATVARLCRASNQRRLNLPYRVGARAQDLPPLLDAARRGEELNLCVAVTAQPRPVIVMAPCTSDAVTSLSAVTAAQRPKFNRPADQSAEFDSAGPMACFATYLDCLESLAAHGVIAAELSACDQVGAAAALVHAEAITVDDALAVLAGQGCQEPFVLQTPPRCTVVVGGHEVLPNEFTDDYLRQLLDGCARTPEAVATYTRRAALLLDHQYTFIRALDRWAELSADRGFDLVELVRDFDHRAPHETTAHLLVTGLAIAVALTEVDRAWRLRQLPWMGSANAELAELICEDIIDCREVVAAVHGEIPLTTLTNRARCHDRVRGDRLDALPLLTELSHTACLGRQLAAANVPTRSGPAAGMSARTTIVIGAPAEGLDLERPADTIHVDTRPDQLSAGLLELWLRGHDIDWAGPQHGVPVRPRDLPGYQFDRNPFWHEDVELRIDGQNPIHAETTTDNITEADDTATDPGRDATQTADVTDRRPEVDSAARDLSRLLTGLLVQLVAEATRLPGELLQPDSPFADIGIDSPIIHQLNNELSTRLGPVSATLFFECRTISDVAARLLQGHPVGVASYFDSAGAQQDPSRLDKPITPRRAAAQPATFAGEPGAETDNGIAIIGFNGRFPGADSSEEFWANLCDGVDSITEIPPRRWDHSEYYDPRRNVPGKVYAKWGGFLSDVDQFDAAAFGIAPVDAMFMDPQERLFLEAVRDCLETAGYTRQRLRAAHGDAGVYVGATFNNYQLVQRDAADHIPGSYAPINSQTFGIANRVSYLNDLHGPSMTVDTACSSSLYAVHLACASLRRKECAMAIAGGVNLTLHPSKYQTLAHFQFLSSDGRCRAFGAGGDGYVPAESVGAFLLKPLPAAVADRDRIYGVIRGSAVTHGGRTNGFTVPDPGAHTTAITRTLRQAGWTADTVSYFEAHGTGTRLGDPIEVAAIRDAYRGAASRRQYCAIGSVKSNIGHAEAAAGCAQLAKVVLQIHSHTLVPSLHAEPANPDIDFADSPVYVQRELSDWEPARMGFGDIPCRAGISSIGAGGSIVHLVIEEHQP